MKMPDQGAYKGECVVCGANQLRIEHRRTVFEGKLTLLWPWCVCGSCGAEAIGKREEWK